MKLALVPFCSQKNKRVKLVFVEFVGHVKIFVYLHCIVYCLFRLIKKMSQSCMHRDKF